MRKTVVFDFDGVIHSYKSGWQGVDVIPDEPVEGIGDAILSIMKAGYAVDILSTRCADKKGVKAMEEWLTKWDIPYTRLVTEKPPAVVYIDDRAICFDGEAGSLLEKIEHFEPWYKKRMTNFDKLKKMSAGEFSVAMLMFRPSDVCFEDDNRNYYALDNTWHKHSQDAMRANLKWLNEEVEE